MAPIHTPTRHPVLLAALILLSAMLALAIAHVAITLSHARQTAWQSDIREIETEVESAAAKIERLSITATQAAAEISAELSRVQSQTDIPVELRRIAARYPDIIAAGIAYGPYAVDSAHLLYAPFMVRRGETLQSARLDDDLDYIQGSSWYGATLQANHLWFAPRYNDLARTVTIDFGRTLSINGADAVILVSLPKAALDEILNLARLKKSGDIVLLSSSGDVIAERNHPTFDNKKPQDFLTPCKRDCHRIMRTLPGTGWTLAFTARQADAALPEPMVKHATFSLTTLSLGLLAVLIAIRLMIRPVPVHELWLWSSVLSVAMAAGIGVVWWFALTNQPAHIAPGEKTMSAAALDDFRNSVLMAAIENRRAIPTIVPTGVFVQSMEFLSANNVVVTGYVWQRVKTMDDAGIFMPEADTLELDEAYRQQSGTETLIGWWFRVTLRQSFGYDRFPLDWESVWIRLRPRELDRSIVLAPDLDHYTTLADNGLPGVERDIVVGGWTPRGSFFDFRLNSYSTNFGLPHRVNGAQPELYFNIVLQRTFLDAFVSHMTPIILVLILLFAMQMTVTREAVNKDLIGFNASTIITTGAALFFAVLLSHIEVRGALAAKEVFYVEYFYFLTYLAILLVCVNSILFTSDRPIRGIHYRDNLLPKLCYWPAITAAMYIITVAVFA